MNSTMPRAISHSRFHFLGTGTSGGVPMIACDCETCLSDDPRDVRTRTGAAVQWIDAEGAPRCVLLDVTPDHRVQAVRAGLWRCDAILFTHNHVDHIFGLDEVRRYNAVMRLPIEIHAEGYVLDALHRVYKHIFDKQNNVNDSFVATLIANRIPSIDEKNGGAGGSIEYRGMRFTPIRLLHGHLPILGFRIEPIAGADPDDPADPFPLAYCTDVSSIPPNTWPHLEGLRTLVLDGLRIRRHPTHLTIDQATEVALQIAARQTYFVHIAHEVKHDVIDPALPKSINLAHDGLLLGDSDQGPFSADRQVPDRVPQQGGRGRVAQEPTPSETTGKEDPALSRDCPFEEG